jgi:hypothetical protein
MSGDLVIEAEIYQPGDYFGAPAGGVHPQWTTRKGWVAPVYNEAA